MPSLLTRCFKTLKSNKQLVLATFVFIIAFVAVGSVPPATPPWS